MKTLLAATAASAALALAGGASAQDQYAPPPGSDPGYDQSYEDADVGNQDAGPPQPDYGSQGYGSQAYGSQTYGQPSGPRSYGSPSTTHYPTNGYQRVPDAGQPQVPYAQDMDPDSYSSGDYGDGGSGYPTDRGGDPDDWNSDQGGPPPAPPGYAPRGSQNYGPPDGANYAPPAAAPSDLLQREQRLERHIRRLDDRGGAPQYATDNLMIVLNSIRDQQDELARRDNGLNFTDRRFIEGRLDRLEEQVRALR